MKLTITSVDYAPAELHDQVPIEVDLLRIIPGPDRPDYWLGRVEKPIIWIDNNIEKKITHLIVAARWAGTQINSNFKNLPVGIAYVTDLTLLEDKKIDFSKSKYIAIGTSSIGDDVPEKLDRIIVGHIGPSFGLAQPPKKSKNLLNGIIGTFKKFTSNK